MKNFIDQIIFLVWRTNAVFSVFLFPSVFAVWTVLTWLTFRNDLHLFTHTIKSRFRLSINPPSVLMVQFLSIAECLKLEWWTALCCTYTSVNMSLIRRLTRGSLASVQLQRRRWGQMRGVGTVFTSFRAHTFNSTASSSPLEAQRSTNSDQSEGFGVKRLQPSRGLRPNSPPTRPVVHPASWRGAMFPCWPRAFEQSSSSSISHWTFFRFCGSDCQTAASDLCTLA